MLSERLVSLAVRTATDRCLKMTADPDLTFPAASPGQSYMLYVHIPFCESLCPYCSFNRYVCQPDLARRYFSALRKEMLMLGSLGYDFDSMYVGGGTPTILLDELCATIDLARASFSIKEVSCETNPNHLTPAHLKALQGRVDRMSCGVQSFDDDLLRQMQRYQKYGSGYQILARLQEANGYFKSLNADMIFNFPAQTEQSLIRDLAFILESGVSQVTFYPLMASPATARKLAETVGKVDYGREYTFYRMICDGLSGHYENGSAWTFNSYKQSLIDEYIVDYDQYPAIGSGGMSYLDHQVFINTFSVREYIERIESGRFSATAAHRFKPSEERLYHLMMDYFGLKHPMDEYQRYLAVAMMRQFFIGVNNLRDEARAALPAAERELLF